MTIRKTIRGTGITESEVFSYNPCKLSPEEKVWVEDLHALHTLDGRLASIENTCQAILQAAGLPTCCRSWFYDEAGNWWGGDVPKPEHAGKPKGIAENPWPVARQRGYENDSSIGFAANMISDIHDIRRSRAAGDHDRAAMFVFYLAVKWTKADFKLKWEPDALRGKKTIESASLGGSMRPRVVKDSTRRVLKLHATGKYTQGQIAQKLGMTRGAVKSVIYRNKK